MTTTSNFMSGLYVQSSILCPRCLLYMLQWHYEHYECVKIYLMKTRNTCTLVHIRYGK